MDEVGDDDKIDEVDEVVEVDEVDEVDEVVEVGKLDVVEVDLLVVLKTCVVRFVLLAQHVSKVSWLSWGFSI